MNEQYKVKRFIIDNYIFEEEPEIIDDNDSFLEKGIIDSTGVMELIMFVEETYEIEVDDEEIIPENFDSVNKLCNYIKVKLESKIPK